MLTSKPPLIFSITLSLNTPLPAQITTDGTLGPQTNLPGPDFQITSDLGSQHGGNLFHSFEVFNVQANERATFTGPANVENILARVTGGQRSLIDGTLRSEIPNANLYLLNPNGIMFGENASLDVQGSFHASTADVLHFQDGGHFDALEPNQSRLTVASPESFGFLSSSPAAISIQGNPNSPLTLEVCEEQTLSFIGGDLTIQDSILLAPSGRINLVALASAGTVFQTADNLAITALGGQIHLSQSNYEPLEESGLGNLDVSGREDGTGLGGRVVIRAGQLFLDQGRIFADTYSGTGGGIDIAVTDKISLENSAQIRANNLCQRDCDGSQGGDIRVTTRHLSFSGWNESYKNDLSQYYLSLESDLSEEDADIEAQIEAQRASLSRIDTNNYGPGRGGNISIQTEVLEMSPGVVETMNASEDTGLPGNIEIQAQQIILTEGGNINAATHSAAKAGQITVNSPELSLFNSSFITASSTSSGVAGDIEINTQRLSLEDSWISGFNSGAGNAGTVHIQAESIFMADESAISTSAEAAGGGDILIDGLRDRFQLSNSWISASAMGDKPEHSGGNLTIGHPNLLILEKSQLFARAINGEGGKIKVQANYFIHSYPFEEKEYFTEFGSQTFEEKINLGFTLIDASSEKSRPGEVRMEAKEWTFAGPQQLPYSFPKLELNLSRCASFSKDHLSRFLITARDILPRSPEDLRTHLIRLK